MGNEETSESKRQNLEIKSYKKKESIRGINRINEIFNSSNNFLIFEDIDKARKSICKIILEESIGTVFFSDFNSFKYL